MTSSTSTDGVPPPVRSSRPPPLFDLVSVVAAPSLVLSGADGQIRPGGAQGWLCSDRRFLSMAQVTVSGYKPLGLHAESRGARRAEFRGVVAELGDANPDPTVHVDRRREVGPHSLTETVSLSSTARHGVAVVLRVEVAVDFAAIAAVRSGSANAAVPPSVDDDVVHWDKDGDTTTLSADPPTHTVDAGAEYATLSWSLDLAPGASAVVRLEAVAAPSVATGFAGADDVPWRPLAVSCRDARLPRLLRQGLDDVGGLLLRDDRDVFAAAGSPWFLTLFGRDALWTARMLMPVGTSLAMSTLRALARRQGTRHDPRTEEQPGRILHEVRAEPLVLDRMTLPPVYYGAVDATPLFVICLAEAWRWGAPTDEVEQLVPAMQRCLRWMEEQAGGGFLRYVDTTGQGLSNQGWKDSEDSIQWADGTLAQPPIALSEAQAYAYQAAILGADLLDAFGEPGGGRWREWAGALAARFRQTFWVSDSAGPYPAIALDADGAAVDSVASNMGHLLGTGLLCAEEEALVAGRLAGADMDSGFGLRTLTRESPTYSRLSYHGGTVWPHDTAIAVAGLARAGFGDEASSLLRGLVRAAPHVDFRLPELYGGDAAQDTDAPTPYPSACRPQAWSAAAPVAGLVGLLGLDVDVPQGRVAARPLLSATLRPMSVSGLSVGDHALSVTVDAAGAARVETDHPELADG